MVRNNKPKGGRMIQFLTHNLLWSHGSFLLIFVAIGFLAGFLLSRWISLLAVGCFLFLLFFFRNPERICVSAVTDRSVIVCPADGKIVAIERYPDGTSFGIAGSVIKIAIFLSVLDVHVNWIAVNGVVRDIVYRPGAYHLAFYEKSSDKNERNEVYIETDYGDTVIVRQIAGFIARRIVCWIAPGQRVEAGESFGMIRFGSRVELILPDTIECFVSVGQRVYGGSTAIGRFIDHSRGF